MNRWLTPRAIGLGVVALLLIAVMVLLGVWQLATYDDRQHNDALAAMDQRPVPLDDVLGPDDPFPSGGVGRPVRVSGSYVAREQIYVRGLDGSPAAYAVVTPLVTDNSAVLVVRGAAARPSAAVPTGPVVVTGFLEPSTAAGGAVDGARTTDGIRVASLVGDFSRDLYGGYVVLARSHPVEPLPAVEPSTPQPSRWAGIRNLLYAVQWWLFAGFVAFMWWRMVRDADPSDASRVG